MSDSVPEPVWPEEDAYPSYRVPMPIVTKQPAKRRSPIDEYVLAAVVATGTVLVGKNKFARKASEF